MPMIALATIPLTGIMPLMRLKPPIFGPDLLLETLRLLRVITKPLLLGLFVIVLRFLVAVLVLRALLPRFTKRHIPLGKTTWAGIRLAFFFFAML